MKKLLSKANIRSSIFLLILLSLCFSQSNSQTVHDINEDVSGYSILCFQLSFRLLRF